MKTSLRALARKIFDIGSGEVLSRLCSVATLLFLAHRFGVVFVGVYALAQGLIQYSYPFIDFGLRHVGVRLLAKYPQAGQEIVQQVQRRRLLMAGVLLPLLALYAASVKLPLQSKLFLFAFTAVGSLYAVSLDWAAWGKERFRLAGFGKAVSPISVLGAVLLGRNSDQVLWFLVVGNFAGYVLQAAIFRRWWRGHLPEQEQDIPVELIRESLAWRRTSVMGLAWFCNMAFASIDMLMLGLMADPRQVGLYSAAYRVINQVLYAYYFLTVALYPQLARQNQTQRVRMLRPRILVSLVALGSVIAGLVTLARRPLIAVLFGNEFLPATLLLILLAWAVPLDFLTSYLTSAYIAWGMERKMLLCTLIAAASNIVLNLIWIPAYGAKAAAVNTLISYVIFLLSLAVAGRSARELAPDAERVPEMIA
jgi:O-antigen/teichoic acid export membrane protein